VKAIIEEDIIVNVGRGETEIGDLPRGIGMERLRWDGSKIVDLADLSEMWVRYRGGVFELHCIEVKHSQLTTMQYSDRFNLTTNGKSIRLKTPQEIHDEELAAKKKAIFNERSGKLNSTIGDLEERHMRTLMLVLYLIEYSRQEPQALADFFDKIIPEIKDLFPLSRVEDLLERTVEDLKTAIEEYWLKMDEI
jgi:hypothetical protein